MVNYILKITRIVLFFTPVIVSFPTYAEGSSYLLGKECVHLRSNAKRLACFDDIFKTPIYAQALDENVINLVVPERVGDIFALTQTKHGDPFDSENELQIALSSEDKSAAVYIACKDNITRFQIALKKPLKISPLKVEIDDNINGKTLSNVNWQNTEKGYLLDAGRGLYAIQQLKSILYIEEFNIILPEENKRFLFKSNGLASRVASIRKECGW